MKRQQDEAFVLGTQELGDADLIVTLLAREHGKVRGVARSARRSRRRFGGVLEPMTRVRATWFERDGRELHRVETLEGVRSFATMQADPERQAACAVISEVSSSFAREGQGEADEFRLVTAVLESMERGGEPRTLLRYFEYWTLRLHGLLPDLDHCGACGEALGPLPRPRPGQGLLCRRCEPGSEATRTLAAGDRRLLQRIRQESPGDLSDDASRGGSRALETLLRGTLEAYAERRFRTYRHFSAIETFAAGGGAS